MVNPRLRKLEDAVDMKIKAVVFDKWDAEIIIVFDDESGVFIEYEDPWGEGGTLEQNQIQIQPSRWKPGNISIERALALGLMTKEQYAEHSLARKDEEAKTRADDRQRRIEDAKALLKEVGETVD